MNIIQVKGKLTWVGGVDKSDVPEVGLDNLGRVKCTSHQPDGQNRQNL